MIDFPKKAKQVIISQIPDQLIKTRPGGGNKTLSYLSGQTVIDMLNEAFNYMWSWEAEKEWVQKSQDKYNPKYDKEPVPQGPVAHVQGKLTVIIPGNNGNHMEIKKTGYGSKAILGTQIDQESVFKAAGTDALKKAASLLGIGLELYRDEEEQLYFEEMNYEDPWTDELLEEYEPERGFIKKFMEDHELNIDDIDDMVSDFSNGRLEGMDDITPDNIKAFVSYLEEQAAAAEEEEE